MTLHSSLALSEEVASEGSLRGRKEGRQDTDLTTSVNVGQASLSQLSSSSWGSLREVWKKILDFWAQKGADFELVYVYSHITVSPRQLANIHCGRLEFLLLLLTPSLMP